MLNRVFIICALSSVITALGHGQNQPWTGVPGASDFVLHYPGGIEVGEVFALNSFPSGDGGTGTRYCYGWDEDGNVVVQSASACTYTIDEVGDVLVEYKDCDDDTTSFMCSWAGSLSATAIARRATGSTLTGRRVLQ